MPSGLSTPLHLAASLLAVAAAVGLAVVSLLGPRALRPAGAGNLPRAADRPHLADLLACAGALAVAAGHGLAGALVYGSGGVVGGLRAAGLVALALGLSPRRLSPPMEQAPRSGNGRVPSTRLPAVVVPVAPAATATVAAAAAAVAAVRQLLGGRRTALVGLALVSWGAAEILPERSLEWASAAWILGALLLGAWLWQAGARRLQARFVTGFVASLLVVVLLLAVVLGTVGSADLVAEELSRLDDFGTRIAATVTDDWPRQARDRAAVLRNNAETLLDVSADDELQLRQVLVLLPGQDFFVLIGPDGRVVSSYVAIEALRGDSFVLAVTGAPAVDRLLAGAPDDGGVITIAGRLVAVGGTALAPRGARPEDAPLGYLVTGSVADDVWVSQEATDLGVQVAIEVGGVVGASSGFTELPPVEDVLAALGPGTARGALTVDGRPLFAAASPVTDPVTGAQLGRLVVVSRGDVIAGVEREQARRLFLLALLGALVAGTSAAILTGRLVAPIRRLTAAAASVREGDLHVAPEVTTPDEVGELGRTFSEMTSSLAAQSDALREAASVQARLRARLEALTESMGDALVAVDSDGRIVTFNPTAERLVGRAVDDVLGLPLASVLLGRGPGDASVTEALGQATSEDTVAVQLLLDGPEGRVIPTAVTAAPVRDSDGAVLGRVFVLRDVSREAEIERMKTEFLSNVSHELRTPLTPIKGYAEVLVRRDVGADATRKFAQQILSSTARLERIVGMIVDFAALDSGRLRMRREPTSLAELVGEVLDAWRDRHPDREFRRRVARNLPPVLVDPGMLRRCLDELLDNAVKFSPGGEPVSITATLQTPANGSAPRMVSLSVRDRGVGIEPDTAAGVFRDFYQVDASETRHFGGLGLGLALVRRIIDGLDGEASIQSEPGVGSTVQLLLPIADADDSASRRPRASARRSA